MLDAEAVLPYQQSFAMYKQHDAHEYFLFMCEKMNERIELPFEFQVESFVSCSACDYQISRAEGFLNLSLPLNSGENLVLSDLLAEYFNEEIIDSVCEKCLNSSSKIEKSLSKHPEVFVILLQRFDTTGMKNRVLVEIPLELRTIDETYELMAVIDHHGDTCTSGHYTIKCKNDGIWYLFDDEKVTRDIGMDVSFQSECYMVVFNKVNP